MNKGDRTLSLVDPESGRQLATVLVDGTAGHVCGNRSLFRSFEEATQSPHRGRRQEGIARLHTSRIQGNGPKLNQRHLPTFVKRQACYREDWEDGSRSRDPGSFRQ
jgi:hypothetical protein